MGEIKAWRLERFLFSKISSDASSFEKFCIEQLQARLQKGSNIKSDFFHYLQATRDPETGESFSTAQILNELNILLLAGEWLFSTLPNGEFLMYELAGADTIGIALSTIMFYLTHNYFALEKVTNEVRSTFTNADDIRANQLLNSCTYLRAVIQESLRMTPPSGNILPREVTAGGVTVDDHFFGEGTILGVPIYTLAHTDRYPGPFDFNPERWIRGSDESTTEESISRAYAAFGIFNSGPTTCIGRPLADREIQITIARLLFAYDVRQQPGSTLGEGHLDDPEPLRRRENQFQTKEIFPSIIDGPIVNFRRRNMA
jgi:cytochrome P450